MTDDDAKATEWVCPECDWIGSPPTKPDVCPQCGHDDLETMTLD